MKSMTLAAAAALLPLLLSNDALAQCEGCQNEAKTRAGRSSVRQDPAPAPAPKRRARGERGTRGEDRPQDGPGARPPREGEGGDGRESARKRLKRRLLKKYDANGNGRLDPKELAKARKDGALPGRGGRGGAGPKERPEEGQRPGAGGNDARKGRRQEEARRDRKGGTRRDVPQGRGEQAPRGRRG